MEFLLFLLIILVVIAHYYPYAALVIGSLIFMLISGGMLAVGNGSFGRSAPAMIGHETFYTTISVALIIITLSYILAHLVPYYPHDRFVFIAIVAVLTLVVSWGGLSFGYQWEVSDVISKSCPTCTDFRNGYRYAYNPTAPLNQCIVWDNAMATTQCLYPSAVVPIGLASILFALMNMGLTYWYTEEVEADIVVKETANNESR